MARTAHRILLPVLMLLAWASASTQPAADPLRQPVCVQALERLKVEEELSRRAGREGRAGREEREGPIRPALVSARRQVAQACLGHDDAAPASPPRAGIAPALPALPALPVSPDRPVVPVPPVPRPVAPIPAPRVPPSATPPLPRGPVVVGVCDPFGGNRIFPAD